jgi:hypothetical protein
VIARSTLGAAARAFDAEWRRNETTPTERACRDDVILFSLLP